eukprot:COSAG05_NODE_249_length_12903_cov_128.635505_1_plen_513_part_00
MCDRAGPGALLCDRLIFGSATAAAAAAAATTGHTKSGRRADDFLLPQQQQQAWGDEARQRLSMTRWTIYGLTVAWCVPLTMLLPAYTEYVILRRCKALSPGSYPGDCSSSEVSASAAQWTTWMLSTCNLCGAASALALGKLADRYGRRPMLMANAGSQVFGSLGLLVVVLTEGPLWLLLPSFLLNGIGGGTPVFTALTMGALADGAKTEAERGRVFGLVTGVSMLSAIFAPCVGGQLTTVGGIGEVLPTLQGGNFQIVFLIFFVGNVVVCACEYALLPETLDPAVSRRERAKPFDYWTATFGSLSILKIVPLRNLFLIYCCVVLALDPMSNLEILYGTLRFQMTPGEVGTFVSGVGLFRAISVLMLFPLVLRLLARKRRALVWGLRGGVAILIVATSCFGLPRSRRGLAWAYSLEGFDGLWQTSISTLFSVVGEENGVEQGQVLSLISFASSVFFTVSPVIFNMIWATTVGWWPGFTFHMITLCACIGLALTMRIDQTAYGSPPHLTNQSIR